MNRLYRETCAYIKITPILVCMIIPENFPYFVVAICSICGLIAFWLALNVWRNISEMKQAEITRRQDMRDSAKMLDMKMRQIELGLIAGNEPAQNEEFSVSSLMQLATPENIAMLKGVLGGSASGGAFQPGIDSQTASGGSSSGERVV